MPWVKLDDEFFDNDKIVNVSSEAKLLYLAGLTYAAQRLTDGDLTTAQVRIAAAKVDVDPGMADELLAAGLWEPIEGGYAIHDYLEYNPSAEDVREQRRQNAIRQGRFRERKRNAVTERVSNARSRNPSPLPDPDTEQPEAARSPNVGAGAREAGLLDSWSGVIYGQEYACLNDHEQRDVEDAEQLVGDKPDYSPEAIAETVRAYRSEWSHLGPPSASAVARNWSRLRHNLVAKREAPDGTHQRSHAETAARRREAFAAAGLLGDTDDGEPGRERHADRPDDLSQLPEPSRPDDGLHDLRRAGDGLPDVSRGTVDREAPPRGPNPDPVPAVRLHDPPLRQRQASPERDRAAPVRAGPATRT